MQSAYLCVIFHVKKKKLPFLAVYTWFLILGKIQSIDVKFIFDSARLGLSISANILQIADVALRLVFLLFLPCF